MQIVPPHVANCIAGAPPAALVPNLALDQRKQRPETQGRQDTANQ